MYPFAHTFDYQQSTTFGFMDIRVEGMGVKRVTKQIVKINVVKVVSDG